MKKHRYMITYVKKDKNVLNAQNSIFKKPMENSYQKSILLEENELLKSKIESLKLTVENIEKLNGLQKRIMELQEEENEYLRSQLSIPKREKKNLRLVH